MKTGLPGKWANWKGDKRKVKPMYHGGLQVKTGVGSRSATKRGLRGWADDQFIGKVHVIVENRVVLNANRFQQILAAAQPESHVTGEATAPPASSAGK